MLTALQNMPTAINKKINANRDKFFLIGAPMLVATALVICEISSPSPTIACVLGITCGFSVSLLRP